MNERNYNIKLSIDGFDFDLKEFPLEKYTDTIVQLTIEFSKFVNIITYCPYCDQQFWLDCLHKSMPKTIMNKLLVGSICTAMTVELEMIQKIGLIISKTITYHLEF
jgi:hypothetical protein